MRINRESEERIRLEDRAETGRRATKEVPTSLRVHLEAGWRRLNVAAQGPLVLPLLLEISLHSSLSLILSQPLSSQPLHPIATTSLLPLAVSPVSLHFSKNGAETASTGVKWKEKKRVWKNWAVKKSKRNCG